MSKKFLFLSIIVCLFSLVIDDGFGQSESIQIELTYPNGDRIPIGNIRLVVSSEENQVIYEEIGKNSENYFEMELPIQQRYDMSVYSHDMLIGSKYLHLDDEILDVIKIQVNPSAGVKFVAYYDDGITPIQGANLKIFSHVENVIQDTTLDKEGKTQRFWLAPTISKGDYYQVDVIKDGVVYQTFPIRLDAGSQDYVITTNWPSKVDSVIINALYQNIPNRSLGNDYQVSISTEYGTEKTSQFVRGKAYFSQIGVGEYKVVIFETNNPSKILANSKITIEGKIAEYNIETEKSSDIMMDLDEFQKTEQIQTNQTIYQDPIDFFTLKWKKQSASGIQKEGFDSKNLLELISEGKGNVVFTRSNSFVPVDISDKNFQISFKIDNPQSINEFWIYFSSDNFETSWYTIKIPITEFLSNKEILTGFNLDDAVINGEPDSSKINQIQVRIKDDSKNKVYLQISDLSMSNKTSSSSEFEEIVLKNCNCVAFRLDDIQDFFLNEVQMDLIDLFLENDVKLTIGVIGGEIGNDQKLTSFLKYNKDNPYLEFANHGWKHEDFAQLSKINQEQLMMQTNDKILNLFGRENTLFIPPLNSVNKDTLLALNSLHFTHYSSEIDFVKPSIYIHGKKLYSVPETAQTGKLDKEKTNFTGLSHQSTLRQIDESLEKYGYAVVTLHPQEFSNFYDGAYHNEINVDQFKELKLLLSKLKSKDVRVTFITEMDPESLLVPLWLKHNAKWWSQGIIDDRTFVNGIKFLISEKIIKTNQPEIQESYAENIPDWVKAGAKWWSEDKLTDKEFVNSIQYLINQKIIKIKV
ncbi:MAG: polysaccharide deacetylase family protein [Nitrosopumilaceae archaeon]|jgi:peptidoglycan/xylan/chitin deacetylase (PgdA/CDA1 family)